MEFSLGGLIPLWILCAPLVVGLLMMANTPKHQQRSDHTRDPRLPQPPLQAQPATGLGQRL